MRIAHETGLHLVETERFKSFTCEESAKRDKVNLDIFWLKDDALEESANLPAPEIIAADFAEVPPKPRLGRHPCRSFPRAAQRRWKT